MPAQKPIARSAGLRRFASSASVTALCSAVAWVGCSIYDASLLQDRAPITSDAGPDASVADADVDGAIDTCEHARWPDRPRADLPIAESEVAFVGALRRVSLGTLADAGLPAGGADIDRVCTCGGGGGSCTPRRKDVCDGDGGRDNAGGDLFKMLARRSNSADLFSEQGLNKKLEDGELGMLLEVREYNGRSDDSSVFVALYPSNGVASPDGGRARALWDGNDVWTRDPDGLLGGGTVPGSSIGIAKYVDERAYVAGGILVAKMDFPLALGASSNGNLNIELSGGVLFGKLVPEGGGYRVEDGQIVGRWSTSKLLTALSIYDDPVFPQKHLCGDSPTYATLKQLICDSVDVTLDPALDHTGAACSAVSIGVGFAGFPAQLGPARARTTDDKLGCGTDAGAWKDDCPR